MDETKEELKNYEITYFSASESADEVKEVLSSVGTEIINEQAVQRVSLAYPIKKKDQAFMGIIQFTADASVLPKINRELSLKPDVLRSIVISYSPKKEKAKQEALEARAAAEASRKIAKNVITPKTAEENSLTNEALKQQIKEISA